MILSDLSEGSSVLIDANILIYAKRGVSEQCRELLFRCASKAVNGILTTLILGEVWHRRMMQESQGLGISGSNPARVLGEKRDEIRKLEVYRRDVLALLSGELLVAAIEREDFAVALELQGRYGLLTNDSLNLAAAKRLGVRAIATADAYFDEVAGITTFRPSDVTS